MTDSKLEPFLLLARSAKGAAAAKVVENATAANGVYTFNALMDVPNIKELSQSPDFQKHWNLLQLFAYGTLSDYTTSPDSYPSLSPQQLTKLKHLTLVSLALEHRSLPYADLLSALDLKSVRELENLIIDCIYSSLLTGKMHHHEQVFYVDQVSGRDLNEAELRKVDSALKTWSTNAESLLKALDAQIADARDQAIREAEEAAAYSKELDAGFNRAQWELAKKDRSMPRRAEAGGSSFGLGGGEGKSGFFRNLSESNEDLSRSRAKRTRA